MTNFDSILWNFDLLPKQILPANWNEWLENDDAMWVFWRQNYEHFCLHFVSLFQTPFYVILGKNYQEFYDFQLGIYDFAIYDDLPVPINRKKRGTTVFSYAK